MVYAKMKFVNDISKVSMPHYKSEVAVLKTSPATVLEDYKKLMHLCAYQEYLPPHQETILKINISWQVYYPACSTTPWQFEGVLKTLLADGYKTEKMWIGSNRTVVVDEKLAMVNNKLQPIADQYGIRTVKLYKPEETEWVVYKPKAEMLVLPKIYSDGIKIPKNFIGTNIIHLPTTKTHVFTQTTGAMKNAFGGLLSERRHWTHAVIHETLVDLLAIQQEIHAGIFAVMDGTIAGAGPGPRAMIPYIKNYLLASSDQVAIDAVAACMMGFDPLSMKYIRLAHERGLGCGDMKKIKILGEDISKVNYKFKPRQETFASRGQKMIYHGPLKPFEKILLQTPLVPWAYFASRLYHDFFWFPLIGKKRIQTVLNSDWGKLFQAYEPQGKRWKNDPIADLKTLADWKEFLSIKL